MRWSDPEATHVTYYATSNRRSPLVKMIGHWPASSGLARSCRAGVQIFCRPVTQQERKMEAESPRHIAVRWTRLEAMLEEEREDQGPELGDMLRAAVEEKRSLIEAKLDEARKREERHERRKARRRGKEPDPPAPPGPHTKEPASVESSPGSRATVEEVRLQQRELF